MTHDSSGEQLRNAIQDLEDRLQAWLTDIADIEGITVRVDMTIRLGDWELKRRIDAGAHEGGKR